MQYTLKIKTTWQLRIVMILIQVLGSIRLINISQACRLLSRLSESGLLVKYRIDGLHKKWQPVPFNCKLEESES